MTHDRCQHLPKVTPDLGDINGYVLRKFQHIIQPTHRDPTHTHTTLNDAYHQNETTPHHALLYTKILQGGLGGGGGGGRGWS